MTAVAGKAWARRSLVNIASDGNDGGECLKSADDPGLADVAGVNDQVRPLERAHGFFAEQSVRIGDQTDAMNQTIHSGCWAVPSNSAVVLKGSYVPLRAASFVLATKAASSDGEKGLNVRAASNA